MGLGGDAGGGSRPGYRDHPPCHAHVPMPWIAAASVASAAVALQVGALALRFAIAPGYQLPRKYPAAAATISPGRRRAPPWRVFR